MLIPRKNSRYFFKARQLGWEQGILAVEAGEQRQEDGVQKQQWPTSSSFQVRGSVRYEIS